MNEWIYRTEVLIWDPISTWIESFRKKVRKFSLYYMINKADNN
jgi:hypothetical protein